MRKGNPGIKKRTLIIQVTSNCNTSCKYCYCVKKKNTLKEKHLESLVFRIWEYFKKTKLPLHIIWHGGEPSLLPVSYWEKVKLLFTPITKKYPLSFAVQTNLVGDNYEVYDFWIENKWKISTSLDGPYDLHSLNRNISRKNFDRLLTNIVSINSKQKNIGTVCVINRHNFLYPEKLLIFFEEINVNVRFNKVVSDHKYIKISYSEYFEFLERTAKLWINSESSIVVEPIFSDILFFLGKRKRSCDRNPYCFGSFLGISATGEIYPCNRLVNFHDLLLGSIECVPLEVAWRKARRKNSDLIKKIRKSFKLPCSDCEANLLCGLGCKAEFIYGEFSSLDRDFYKKFCLPFQKYVKTIKKIAGDIANEFGKDILTTKGRETIFNYK